jgi:hypothetical protein
MKSLQTFLLFAAALAATAASTVAVGCSNPCLAECGSSIVVEGNVPITTTQLDTITMSVCVGNTCCASSQDAGLGGPHHVDDAGNVDLGYYGDGNLGSCGFALSRTADGSFHVRGDVSPNDSFPYLDGDKITFAIKGGSGTTLFSRTATASYQPFGCHNECRTFTVTTQ